MILSPTTGMGQKIVADSSPEYGELQIRFLEENIIKESNEDPRYSYNDYLADLVIDRKGNCYLLDRDRIIKYDAQGKYLQAIGKIGEGPGEFQLPLRLFVHERGDIFLVDASRKIEVYDQSGRSLRRLPLEFSIPIDASDIFVDRDDQLFTTTREMSREGISKVLIKTDKKGTIIKRLLTLEDLETKVKGSGVGGVMGGVSHPYSEKIIFCPVQGSRLCYGLNSKYELSMIDLDGRIQWTLSKREVAAPVTAEEIRRFGEAAVVPSRRPFFDGILSDERGRIYVMKTKSVIEKSPKTEIDIFSSAGKYLYRTEVPFRPRTIMNGSFYSIEQDENQLRMIKKWTILNYDKLKSD